MSLEREKRSTSQPESYRDFNHVGRTDREKEEKGESDVFMEYYAPSEDPVLGVEGKAKKKLESK